MAWHQRILHLILYTCVCLSRVIDRTYDAAMHECVYVACGYYTIRTQGLND